MISMVIISWLQAVQVLSVLPRMSYEDLAIIHLFLPYQLLHIDSRAEVEHIFFFFLRRTTRDKEMAKQQSPYIINYHLCNIMI